MPVRRGLPIAATAGLIALAVALIPGPAGAGAAADGAQSAVRVKSTILKRAALRPPRNNPSKARGSALVIRQQGQIGLVLKGSRMPRSVKNKPFAIWLYTKPSRKRFLGFIPEVVGRSRRLESISRLSGSHGYRHILITRESQNRPSRPGTTIIRGRLRRPR